MSDQRDLALLDAFCEWYWFGRADYQQRVRPSSGSIDAFLAARQPPEPIDGIYIPGPDGPIRVDEDYTPPARIYPQNEHDDAPPAPQRFWRVHTAHMTSGSIAWICDAHGKNLERLTPIMGPRSAGRPTREDAEADGRASGLQEWRP